jgi:hypothetical protein
LVARPSPPARKEVSPIPDHESFANDGILPDYSLEGAVRGKYPARYAKAPKPCSSTRK